MEEFNLDRIPGKVLPVGHVSQYDVGRNIRINLFDGNSVYTLTGTEVLTCSVRKPDGTVVTRSITNTSSNYILLVVSQQMTACAGSCLCEIVIENSGGTIGTCNFILEVEPDPMDGGVNSQSEIHDLQAQVNNCVINLASEILPAGLTTNWEMGALNVSSGGQLDISTRIRTRYINPEIAKNIFKFKCAAGYQAMCLAYDDGNNYLGVVFGDGSITPDVTNWKAETIINNLNLKLRIVMRKSDDSAITLADYTNIEFFGFFEPDPRVVRDLAVFGQSVANKEGYVYFETVGKEYLENGAFNSSGADAGTTYSGSSKRTNTYFAIREQTTHIRAFIELISDTYNFYNYICFYDENFTFISRSGGLKYYNNVASVPAGAKFFRVSYTLITLNYVDNIKRAEISQAIIDTSTNSPQNKWFVLGDSISAGYFSMTQAEATAKGYTLVYKPSDYGYPVYDVGSAWKPDLSHNYWGYANKWFLHRDLQPNAYPGQGYLKTAGNGQNGIDVVKALDFSDAGLITVAWGFNDWHYNQVRGDHNLIDPSVPYPEAGYDTSQITTVNQAIWFCLGELIRKAPNARIVVQLPMNGWLYGGDFSTNWGIGYQMSNSGKLADIHDDIKFWADYYGLQVLDMTYNNSTINRRNIKDVELDGSHPTDLAHQQLGRYVATALHYI